jgi:hypothetical protein
LRCKNAGLIEPRYFCQIPLGAGAAFAHAAGALYAAARPAAFHSRTILVTQASTNVTFFSGLLQTVADRGRALVGYRRTEPASVERLLATARRLLTGRGACAKI